MVVVLLGVGEGEPAVDLEGLSAFVSAVGLDEGVVDTPWVLSQVNRKCRSWWGLIGWVSPAASA